MEYTELRISDSGKIKLITISPEFQTPKFNIILKFKTFFEASFHYLRKLGETEIDDF